MIGINKTVCNGKRTDVKILAIAGSPVKGGNTDILLDSFLKGAGDEGAAVNKIYALDLCVEYCTSCGICLKTGRCTIKDDMHRIYEAIEKTDVMVIASPVYFMSFPAQLKVIIDRCQPMWAPAREQQYKHREKKKRSRYAYLIATSGGKYKGTYDGIIATAKSFFATIGYRYSGELVVSDTDRFPVSGMDTNKPPIADAYSAGRIVTRIAAEERCREADRKDVFIGKKRPST